MSKSIKLQNNTYLDSSSIVHNKKNLKELLNNFFSVNFIDNEIVPTNEYDNGKRIYAYKFKFSQALTKATEYTFDLPFADEIDSAWVDLSNSFMDNHLGTSNYNTWCLGTTTGYNFRLGISAKNKLSIIPDDNWGANWTYTIVIKFKKITN